MEILSVMNYAKKNLSVIVVILLTLLLIGIVIWVFDKKIETVEKQMNPTTSYLNTKFYDPFLKTCLLTF